MELDSIQEISINIDNYIIDIVGDELYKSLNDDVDLQLYIELYLNSFITSKYKNIFIVDIDNSKQFRVLADGRLKLFAEKLSFNETFRPKNSAWEKVVKTKEPISFRQDRDGLWQTYLHPMLKGDRLIGILAIDFSIENFNQIQKNLKLLDNLFYTFIIVMIISIILLLLFSYLDFKREKKIQRISDKLALEIGKVKELNNSLERKVDNKVAEIKRSQAYFETIFNTTRDAIAVIDNQTNFLFANRAYFDLIKLSRLELYQKSSYEITIKDDRDRVISLMEEGFRRGFYYDMESTYINCDGDNIDVIHDMVAMPDGVSFLLVTRDITIENQLKREKEFHQQQLLQQSRLAQMGEMISMIAHQWRQPLAAIGAASAKIRIKAHLNRVDNEMTIKTSDKIEGLVQHLSQTIDDFRNFFKSDKIEREITYTQMIDSILEIATATIVAKHIILIKSLKCEDKMSTYASEVKQVILNLLKNAEDALIETETPDPTIVLSTYRDGDRLILEVSDNAGGIPESIIGQIFDPYFSTKKEKNGTGLGLYMSKIIIEEHCGGRLSVYNNDKGAVFKISMKSI
jgi:PAS domain S-box-containing protein